MCVVAPNDKAGLKGADLQRHLPHGLKGYKLEDPTPRRLNTSVKESAVSVGGLKRASGSARGSGRDLPNLAPSKGLRGVMDRQAH